MTGTLTGAPLTAVPTSDLQPVRKRPRPRRRVLLVSGLVVISVSLMTPFALLLSTALKSSSQMASTVFIWFPVPLQIGNFIQAVTVQPFWHYAANSFFLASVSGLLTTFSSALVGYGFARLNGPGKKLFFGVLISMMMVPPIITLIPTYLLFAKVGLVGTYWPWVLWGLAGSPYLTFLYRQFFAGLPRELEEAARLDGCSRFGIFMRIFLPLSKPVIVTVFVLSFTGVWGDFITPNLLLNQDNTTLAVAIVGGYSNQAGFPMNNLVAAGSILYVIPMIIVFVFAQRSYVRGFATSGIK
jgi:multiple sugar transport system permease protein